jgi:polyphosphate kinase 2 (PPK2 family)
MIGVWNRSHYEDVLIVRVHKLVPKKVWKVNPNDIKERVFWNDYQQAYEDAIKCCGTNSAPWHVVPANHKRARSLFIADLVLRVLKKMDLRYPKLLFDPKTIKIE